MTVRREMHFLGPPRKRGHECDPELVPEHGSLAAALAFDDVAVKAAAGLPHVARLRRQLAFDDRGHEWGGVDLSVRMAERDADRLTSILEDEHVPDVGKLASPLLPIPPGLHHPSA